MGKSPIVPKQFFIAHSAGQGAKVQFALQNLDFPTSNRFKTIGVLTCTQCLINDDRLAIGYLQPDFQLI